MSQIDPTDSALAAIASIFEKPEPKPAEKQPVVASEAVVDAPETIVEAADPAPPAEAVDAPETAEAADPVETAQLAEDIDVDSYSKSGPGPLEQLRFKWTARRAGDDQYYVDETIGHTSLPISSGPMPREAVIGFIDEREREARMRFDALRSQIFDASERGRESAN